MSQIKFYVTGQDYDFLANTTNIPVKINIGGKNYNTPCSEAIYQACKNINNSTASNMLKGSYGYGSRIQKEGKNIAPHANFHTPYTQSNNFAPGRSPAVDTKEHFSEIANHYNQQLTSKKTDTITPPKPAEI